MNNKIKFPVISGDHNLVFLSEFKNREIILIKGDYKDHFKIYKNIKASACIFDNEEWTIIGERENQNSFIITYLFEIFLKHYPELTIKNILEKYSSIFETTIQINNLKFRGDFAELLFIWHNPKAIKLEDSYEADVNLNGEYIEIKSYSKSRGEIIISQKQLNNNKKIALVPLELDSEKGIDIITLAHKIKNNKPFIEYILQEYKMDVYKNYQFFPHTPHLYKIKKHMKIRKYPEGVKKIKYVYDVSFFMKEIEF